MYVVFALATGLSNAFAVTSQHIASTSSAASVKGWALVRHLFAHPLWLLGWLGLFGSLIFQALALHLGPLVSVQPLLLMELVFALGLRRFWLRQRITPTAWVGAVVCVVALGGFLVVADPASSSRLPSLSGWVFAGVVIGVISLVTVIGSWRASPAWRAGAMGAVTSLVWAGEACLIKEATDTVLQRGWGSLEQWPVYAFAVVGLGGVLLEQATLHVGPLRSSLPFIVAVDPVASLILGLTLFGEQLRGGALFGVADGLLVAVALVATLVLVRTTPDTMGPDVRHL